MSSRAAKALTYLVGAATLTLVASPARQYLRPEQERVDGFPLSHFPMFSAARTRSGKVTHLVGLDGDGGEHILHHRHAGTGGLNQVRRQINRQVREDRAPQLAARVATSVAASSRSADRPIEEVQVVTSRHRFDDFFAGDRTPRRRRIHATAPVHRA